MNTSPTLNPCRRADWPAVQSSTSEMQISKKAPLPTYAFPKPNHIAWEANTLPLSYTRSMEATGGFEPPNKSLANSRLNLLATSPYGIYNNKTEK